MEAGTRWDTVEGGAMKGEHGDMKKDSTRAHPTNPAFWLRSEEATPQPLPGRQVPEAEAKSLVVLPSFLLRNPIN